MWHALQAAQRLFAMHGPLLLLGATLLLGSGWLFALLFRRKSPVHAQRVTEATLICTGAWIVLACCPLPRVSLTLPTAAPVKFAAQSAPDTAPPPIDISSLTSAEIDAVYASVLTSPGAASDANPVNTTNELGGSPVQPPAEPSLSPDTRAESPVRLADYLSRTYLLGVALSLGWLGVGHAILWRMVRRAKPASTVLQSRLRAHWPAYAALPRLLVSDACGRPISFGVFRRTILLPSACVNAAGAPLQHVLLHEIAHLRQGDAWGSALFNLLLPVLWIHPFYWLLRGQAGLSRELVADDWAARHSDKATYIKELIALARRQTRYSGRVVPAVGLFRAFFFHSDFYRRMHMLIQRNESLPTRCSPLWRVACAAACAATLLVSSAVLGVRPARADDDVKDALAKVIESNKESNESVDVKTADLAHPDDAAPNDAQALTDGKPKDADATADAAPKDAESLTSADVFANAKSAESGASVTISNDLIEGGDNAEGGDGHKVHQRRSKKSERAASRHDVAETKSDGFKVVSDSFKAVSDHAGERSEQAHAEADLAREQGEREREQADREREKADREREQADRERDQADRERENATEQVSHRLEEVNEEIEKAEAMARKQIEEMQVEIERARDRAQQQLDNAQAEFEKAQDHFTGPDGKEALERARRRAMDVMQKARSELQMYHGLDLEARQKHFRNALSGVDQKLQRERDTLLKYLEERHPDVIDATKGKVQKMRASIDALKKHPNDVVEDRPRDLTARAPTEAKLDIVSLASNYSDAVGDVEVAKARVEQAKKKGGDVGVEEATFRRATAKAALLRNIAQVAADAAREDLERYQKLGDARGASVSEKSEIETKAKILGLILERSDGQPRKF